MKNGKRRQELVRRVAEQQHWIEKCGGSLGEYLARYAEPDDPDRGARIWQADNNTLRRLKAALAEVKS